MTLPWYFHATVWMLNRSLLPLKMSTATTLPRSPQTASEDNFGISSSMRTLLETMTVIICIVLHDRVGGALASLTVGTNGIFTQVYALPSQTFWY